MTHTERIRKWLAGGLTVTEIAAALRISRDEVRDLSRDDLSWAPTPEQIREETAKIRAGWSEMEWYKAATLNR